jgi:hypothetical protein
MSHVAKRQKLGLFARMGGPFVRCFFILEIYGDELDPDEVSSTLGVQPTKCYRKGDKTPNGTQYRRTGGWFIDSGEQFLSEEEPGSSLFEKWVSSLPADRESWNILKKDFNVLIRLVGYTDQMNAEFILTSAAAVELASRGLPVVFDPYLSLDDEEM